MKTPILGSSYVARSVNAADSRMVNLFPEIVPEAGKEAAFLSRCPAFVTLNAGGVGTGPIRGLYVFQGLLYIVSGSDLYTTDTSFVSFTNRNGATPIVGSGPVVMADNGTQLFIACSGNGIPVDGTSYIWDIAGTLITEMVPGVYANFPGAITVAFIDGFFVVNEPDTSKVWCSALYDGLTWDATHFASAESSPDDVVGVFAIHKELWVFGNNTIEVWYNTGSAGFPFAPIQGVLIEIGCASPYTIAQMDNSVFWLSGDQRGHGMVYRADGYTAKRVSTHAVEWQIQSYTDLSTALAFTYQQDGHQFYVLVFPDENTSWVYDAATQAWHERASWDGSVFDRYDANCAVFFSNEIVVGSSYAGGTGHIFKLDLDDYSDITGILGAVKWLRSWRALPTGTNNLTRSIHHSLQLDCEPSPYTESVNDDVTLRWSDDGGHSWSSGIVAPMNSSVAGQRVRRIIWRRLGATMKLRDRVYEVSSSALVKATIMGAELLMSTTNA